MSNYKTSMAHSTVSSHLAPLILFCQTLIPHKPMVADLIAWHDPIRFLLGS